MQTRTEITERLERSGLIAIVRLRQKGPLPQVAEALVEGGINTIEFTLNTPDAYNGIEDAAKAVGEHGLIGAGTVLNAGQATRAIESGAEFIISPDTNREVVLTTIRLEKVPIPGAFTPTEIVSATRLGVELIKLFPANMLGPDYVKAVRGPMSDVKLIPTGGVRLENMAAYWAAGASALALGNSLVNDGLVEDKNFHAITDNARRYREAFEEIRA